jgi:hypothetical protein
VAERGDAQPSWDAFDAAVAKELQDDLEDRVARLPVRRLRRFSDLMLLQGVEYDHIIRLLKRYGLPDSDHPILQTLWFARIDPVLEPDIERLRRAWATRQAEVHRRINRLGKYHLGALYWNTFGPGGETWFGDHLPVRRLLLRLHWRP